MRHLLQEASLKQGNFYLWNKFLQQLQLRVFGENLSKPIKIVVEINFQDLQKLGWILNS